MDLWYVYPNVMMMTIRIGYRWFLLGHLSITPICYHGERLVLKYYSYLYPAVL